MTLFSFSTDDFPEHDRIAAWREVFGERIARLDMEPPGDRPFRGSARIRTLPDLAIGWIASTANRIARTPRLLADGSDDIMVGIILDGQALVSQRQRGEVIVGHGQAVVWSNREAGYSQYDEALAFLSVAIPRPVLARSLVDPEAADLSVIAGQSEALHLLSFYLRALMEQDLPPHLGALSASHVHDLVAAALGANREAAEMARGRGIRAARLHAIKADIIANLGRRALSADDLAVRHRISPRYIRALFDGDGTTLTDFILGQRLARAYRMLTDWRHRHLTISAIAYDSGFGDLSYFNRVFRRRYEATPSEVRAQGERR